MRGFIVIAMLSVFLAACQGTNSSLTSNTAQGTTSLRARSALPLLPSLQPAPLANESFSRPNDNATKGPPFAPWIFAADGEFGNVDVYDAKTLAMISQCPCTGVGVAVDPASGDLAVGSRSGTVTIWHVKSKQITLFSTLKLSNGPYAIGLAY